MTILAARLLNPEKQRVAGLHFQQLKEITEERGA